MPVLDGASRYSYNWTMKRMKTALEIALERAESLGATTPQQKLEYTLVPKGERLAAVYLRGEGDLAPPVDECDAEGRPYLVKGILKVLMHNLKLPRTEGDHQTNQRVLPGIRLLKVDKKAAGEIVSRVQHICDTFLQYRQQGLDQVYEQTRDRFQRKAQEALRTYSGVSGSPIVNVESMPEFQQEWARVVAQFDSQYDGPLEEQKSLLESLP